MVKMAQIITRLTLGGAQETVYHYYRKHNKDKYILHFLAGPQESFNSKEYIELFQKDKNFKLISSMLNPINPIKDIKAFWQIYRYFKKEKFQLVHTHSSKAGLLGRLAAKLAGVPVIIHTVHGWSFHSKTPKIQKFIFITLERIAAMCCTKLVVVTNRDIDKGLINGIGKKSQYVVIRSGIDFSRYDNPKQDKIEDFRKISFGKKIIGTIGRLSEQKNPFDFIKIAKILTQKRRDVHFVWVGDGELRSIIEDRIRVEGLERNVSIIGLRNDIETILRTFDVFILTSLWEGLPRVLPEAMYCKVPVIANGVDGVNEIIENGVNGYITKPYEIMDAVRKIENLLDHPATKEQLVHKGYTSVYREYSAQYMVEKLEELYDSELETSYNKLLLKRRHHK